MASGSSCQHTSRTIALDIFALDRDRNNQRLPYLDNKCFFRYLALHQGANIGGLDSVTDDIINQWGNGDWVDMDNLRELESGINMNIHVYQLEEDAATLVRRPIGDNESHMNMNLYEGHFLYINNIQQYAKSWKCEQSDKLFNHLGYYNEHARSCYTSIKRKFPGGGIGAVSHTTIFDDIQELWIQVEEEDRYYPFRITFDIKTLFQ